MAKQEAKILEGVRVFDMTLAAVGPWATMLLGALGADVIKIEAPGAGDIARYVPPFVKGLSVLYFDCNMNKRGIVLDLKSPRDKEIAYKLLETSDIFMENMRAGVADRIGFGYEQVAKINPKIIYGTANAWGTTGPMAPISGADPSVQAFCGWTSINGTLGGKPEMYRHVAHIDLTTSCFFASAILQALVEKEKTGKGMKVDITMLGSALNLQTSRVAEFFATGKTPPRVDSAVTTTVPHQAFQCQEGKWIAVGVVEDSQWQRLCKAIGAEDLAKDSKYSTNPLRVINRNQLIPRLEAIFKTKPVRWWEIKLDEHNVPNGRFNDFVSLRGHPQVVENEFMFDLDSELWGHVNVGGLPWRFSKAAVQTKRNPNLGEHTEEVLKELGYPPATPAVR